MTRIFQPTWYNRAVIVVFVVPCALLMLVGGVAAAIQSLAASIGLIACGLLLMLWMVFITTSHVKLDSHVLTRSWAMGRVVIPLEDVARLEWGGGRGQSLMTIRAKANWIMLSSLSFKREELKEMEDHILAARGIADQPRWPPYAPTIVDLDEMVRRRGTS